MNIIEIRLTESGIRLVGGDGSSVDVLAEDALELAAWIEQRRTEVEKRVPHGCPTMRLIDLTEEGVNDWRPPHDWYPGRRKEP